METLTPLKNKLKRLHTQVTNVAHDVLDLAQNSGRSDEIAQEVEKITLTLVDTVMRLRASTSRGAARGKELGGIGEIADKLSDALLSIDNLALLNRLNYVQLATMMNTVDPELVKATFDELATLQNGWEKIELIHKAAQEKLSMRVR